MEHRVEIEKIIHGGDGLARLADGMVVMVPYVLPGEEVLVREVKRSKQFVRAEPVSILTPSPLRITPPCPYYTLCGGCNLQHMEYAGQLEAKGALVKESFSRAKLDTKRSQIDTTLPSPNPFVYRHRIRLHLEHNGSLGFHRSQSRQVITVKRCLLATRKINAVLERLQLLDLAYTAKQWKAIELIDSPDDGKLSLVLHSRQKHAFTSPPDYLREIGADYIVVKSSLAYRDRKAPKDTSKLKQHFSVSGRDYTLTWDSHCFFQVNAEMNHRLVHFVCDQAGTDSIGALLDLFCGIGNFSIPLALLGRQVTGVEHNMRSITHAEANIPDSIHQTPRFLCSDVTEALAKFNTTGRQFQLIVLDPPRQGLGKEASRLTALLNAEKIIYISCDPATLARDLVTFNEHGYHIKRITPVDMFPQTHHVESVVVLEKN